MFMYECFWEENAGGVHKGHRFAQLLNFLVRFVKIGLNNKHEQLE
jgi:hypothetical protein